MYTDATTSRPWAHNWRHGTSIVLELPTGLMSNISKLDDIFLQCTQIVQLLKQPTKNRHSKTALLLQLDTLQDNFQDLWNTTKSRIPNTIPQVVFEWYDIAWKADLCGMMWTTHTKQTAHAPQRLRAPHTQPTPWTHNAYYQWLFYQILYPD